MGKLIGSGYYIVSHRIVSNWFLSYPIVSYYIVSNRIVSHLIGSYRILSYHIVSYQIVFYRILLVLVVSYHIISYHIVLNHILLVLIVYYRIVSYRIVLYKAWYMEQVKWQLSTLYEHIFRLISFRYTFKSSFSYFLLIFIHCLFIRYWFHLLWPPLARQLYVVVTCF